MLEVHGQSCGIGVAAIAAGNRNRRHPHGAALGLDTRYTPLVITVHLLLDVGELVHVRVHQYIADQPVAVVDVAERRGLRIEEEILHHGGTHASALAVTRRRGRARRLFLEEDLRKWIWSSLVL